MTIRLKNVRVSYLSLKRPARTFEERTIAGQLARRVGMDPTPYIVGYDPQKLLPAPVDPYKSFADMLLASMAKTLGVDYNSMAETYDAGDRRWFPLSDFPAGGEINLTGRRARTFDDVAVYRVTNERFVRVDPANIDFSEAEMLVLAAQSRERMDQTMLRLLTGKPLGEMYVGPQPVKQDYDFGMIDKPHVVETSGGRRDKAYLKHDRTKRHGRRRR